MLAMEEDYQVILSIIQKPNICNVIVGVKDFFLIEESTWVTKFGLMMVKYSHIELAAFITPLYQRGNDIQLGDITALATSDQFFFKSLKLFINNMSNGDPLSNWSSKMDSLTAKDLELTLLLESEHKKNNEFGSIDKKTPKWFESVNHYRAILSTLLNMMNALESNSLFYSKFVLPQQYSQLKNMSDGLIE